MKTACLFVLLALAGCVSQEELQARQEAYVNAIRSRCEAYGFTPGTPQMSNCMMQLDASMRNASARNNALMLQQSNALMQMGQPKVIPPAQTPQRTQCIPAVGGGMNCTTY